MPFRILNVVDGTVVGRVGGVRRRVRSAPPRAWPSDARRLGGAAPPGGDLPPVEFAVIEVSFDAVANPALRECLQNLPTSLALHGEAVDRLRATGAQLLLESPAFRTLVEELTVPR